jgi:enamine deaminase RidA (YjgF/YER057c/UK114 family)
VIIPGFCFSQNAEEKLKELKIELPAAQTPKANYVNAVRVGNLLFLAGKGPTHPDGTNTQVKLVLILQWNKGMKPLV